MGDETRKTDGGWFPSIIFQKGGSSARNREQTLPIVQTPWYDDDIKVSPFYNGPTSGDKNPPTPKSNH